MYCDIPYLLEYYCGINCLLSFVLTNRNNRYSQNLYESSEDSDEVDSLNDGD
jgi:hypothetical protein